MKQETLLKISNPTLKFVNTCDPLEDHPSSLPPLHRRWFTILDYGEAQGTVSRSSTARAGRLSEPCEKRHHAVNELN